MKQRRPTEKQLASVGGVWLPVSHWKSLTVGFGAGNAAAALAMPGPAATAMAAAHAGFAPWAATALEVRSAVLERAGDLLEGWRARLIALLQAYVFPFEAVSILLLAAIVGALVLSGRGVVQS